MHLLKNAMLYTMTGKEPFQGDIRIAEGKIQEVGVSLEAKQGEIILDLQGKHIMPGMIDAHTHIGMWEDGLNFEGSDGNEMTDPITPQLRGRDGINPFDRAFQEAYEGGVTTVATGPGSGNVMGGTFVIMKTKGRDLNEMILRDPLAMKVAFGENPKTVYNEQRKMPMTRMGSIALLREMLFKAKNYAKKIERAKGDESKLPDFDMQCEALLPVIRKEIPLKAHAHRADDILAALDVAKEFDCDITLDHCTEGYIITDQLKEAHARVILGPLLCDRSKPELKNLTLKAPCILEEAGLPFAMMSDHPVTLTQNLPLTMALAVREGLSRKAALEAITINAARILEIDDRLGSIEEGKDADLVVFSQEPLDMQAKTCQVWMNGQRIFTRETK